MRKGITRIFVMIAGIAATTALTGCGEQPGDTSIDTGGDVAELVPKPTVSGKAILADTGEGLPGATVRLRIGGEWYESTTTGGDSNETGDFVFEDVPSQASFFIEIVPKEDDYASSYTFGTTNKTDSGISADDALYDLSFDVGSVAVYEAAPTSIKAYDVDTGEPITGLGMWIEPADFGTGNSLTAGEIATPYVRPDAAEGQYTFDLPRKGGAVDVYINGLVDSEGVIYQTLAGDILQPGNLDGECNPVSGPTGGETLIDPCDTNTHDDGSFEASKLTTLSPAVDSPLYLRKYSPSELTVNFELLDANGEAYEAGRAITVQDVDSGQVFAAEQSESQTNLYSIVIPYERDLTFAVASMDRDGDGLKDTSTALAFDSVDRKSEQTEATLAVTISELTDYTPIEAEVVSESLVPDQVAEAVIVFNQPVVPTGDNAAQVHFSTLNDDIEAIYPEDYQQPDQIVWDDSDGGTSNNLVLNQDTDPNADDYIYTNNQGGSATFTLPGAREDNGSITDPYERRVHTVQKFVDASATATNSTNTIYRISFDPGLVGDLQQVDYSLTVRSVQSGEMERVQIPAHSADSTASFSGLVDLVLDNGNFVDDTTDGVLKTNPDNHVSRNGDLTYTIDDTSSSSNCGNTDCLFVADQAPSDLTGISDAPNQRELVSPVEFYGSVRLSSYEYETNESGNAVTETRKVRDDPIYVYHTQNQLDELVAEQGDANNFCPEGTLATCTEKGSYYYFLEDPANEDLDDKDGTSLSSVYGASVEGWARGYARSTGLGYAVSLQDLDVDLPDPANDLLKSMTLDMDVMVNGKRYTETLTLNMN